MSADTKDVQESFKTALSEHGAKVKEAMEALNRDVKTYGSVQEGVKDAIAKLNVDGAKLVGEHQKLMAEKAATDARILDLEQKILARGVGPGPGSVRKSLGQQFIESPEWKDFAGRAGSMRMSMKPFQTKNITTLTAGAGAFPEFLPTTVTPPFQPLAVRDLLDHATTQSNLIIWVQETLFTNSAAPVHEGNLKPQSDITYERKQTPVTTIAHWIKVSKQILADYGQLQSLIDGRLRFGLKFAEERELLYGDGTGDHLLGLVPQSTAYTGVGARAGTDTRIDVIRHAMLQVNLAFYPATGIVMSPTDWHAIETEKDTLGRYIIGSPTASIPGMLWGLPVAMAYSMAPGEFIVGALKLAATLFDREEAQMLVSNEDQDNFVRNLVTVLAEERLALAVSRPAAIVHGFIPAGESAR